MEIFGRRLIIIALTGLVCAASIGLWAPNVVAFAFGTLILGIGMILGILFYLLRPIHPEQIPPLIDPDHPVRFADLPLIRTPTKNSQDADIERPSATVIPIRRAENFLIRKP